MAQNGWDEYQNLVLSKLDQLESDVRETRKDVQGMRVQYATDITELKVKAGLAGGIFGFIASAGAIVIKSLFTKN